MREYALNKIFLMNVVMSNTDTIETRKQGILEDPNLARKSYRALARPKDAKIESAKLVSLMVSFDDNVKLRSSYFTFPEKNYLEGYNEAKS